MINVHISLEISKINLNMQNVLIILLIKIYNYE